VYDDTMNSYGKKMIKVPMLLPLARLFSSTCGMQPAAHLSIVKTSSRPSQVSMAQRYRANDGDRAFNSPTENFTALLLSSLGSLNEDVPR
jgi:hypothetical protein